MKKQYFLTLLITVTLGLMSFSIPKNLQKKVVKEIKKTFSIENFSLSPVEISEEVNSKLTQKINSENLYKISIDDQIYGYAFIAKAPSKTDEFDYLILLDKDLIVAKTKILIYREDYGGEIGSKRWLKQFIGKKAADSLKYEDDVIAISGATISALSMTNAVNTFLQDLKILHDNQVL